MQLVRCGPVSAVVSEAGVVMMVARHDGIMRSGDVARLFTLGGGS